MYFLCTVQKGEDSACVLFMGTALVESPREHPWLMSLHKNVLFCMHAFPYARACSGTGKDIGLEGCPVVYRNLCYLVTLQQTMTLQSIKFALLDVVRVIHISVYLQTCQLSGNVDALVKFDF